MAWRLAPAAAVISRDVAPVTPCSAMQVRVASSSRVAVSLIRPYDSIMTATGASTPVPPTPRWTPPDPSRWGIPRIVGALMVATAALVIAIVRYVAEGRYQSGPERVLQAAAFGLLVASPAVLAAMSPRRRAILLAPAALLLTPLAFLSFAGVLLPLLIPGVLFWWALVTRWDRQPCGLLRGAASILVVVALVVAGGVALFARDDPRSHGDAGCSSASTGSSASGTCAATAGSGPSGSTSDVVTSAEALTSIGLVTLALLSGWLLAAPRRPRRRAAP
jgi:hypothetical protein